jgi:hypothetical protein
MRDLHELDRYRLEREGIRLWGWPGDETCGAFGVPSCIDRELLVVIASSELGWDHLSVSRRNRCPNWPEMQQIKRLFFQPTETAMQLHVAEAAHINVHPHTLHIWRPNDGREIPQPPAITV